MAFQKQTYSLDITHSELKDAWSELNEKSINEVTAGSRYKAWWNCLQDNRHPAWLACVADRTRGTGCPVCSHRAVHWTNSLKTSRPDLLNEWDFSQEWEFGPEDILPRSNKIAPWKCKKCSFQYQTSVDKRSRGVGCPACAGKVATMINCLAVLKPQLADQWSSRNNLTPCQVTPGSRYKAWWKCAAHESHPQWQATVANRALSETGCPKCAKGPYSKIETILKYELEEVLRIPVILAECIEIKGRKFEVDIFLPKAKVIIEYDGNYWHQGADRFARDQMKTQSLKDAGYTIIRIREAPLEKIQEEDILIPNYIPYKKILNLVLIKLQEVHSAGSSTQEFIKLPGRVEKYLAQDSLWRLQEAEKFYSSIIEKKAGRKF